MKQLRISSSAAVALAFLLLLGQPSQAGAENRSVEEVGRWVESAEFTSFVADPSLILRKAATEDNYSAAGVAGLRKWALEHLPEHITQNRVTDAGEVAKLREKLRPLFDRFPVVSRLEIVLYRDEVAHKGRVYDAPFVGMGERVLLVVSKSAAEKFTGEELRAAVAHECGHLPHYEAYAEALVAQDADKVRAFELQADATGMVLLDAIGDDPDAIYRAVSAQQAYLKRFGQLDPLLVKLHPTLPERDAVRKLVSKLLKERRKPGAR